MYGKFLEFWLLLSLTVHIYNIAILLRLLFNVVTLILRNVIEYSNTEMDEGIYSLTAARDNGNSTDMKIGKVSKQTTAWRLYNVSEI